jgi:hypothetical protein
MPVVLQITVTHAMLLWMAFVTPIAIVRAILLLALVIAVVCAESRRHGHAADSQGQADRRRDTGHYRAYERGAYFWGFHDVLLSEIRDLRAAPVCFLPRVSRDHPFFAEW